MDKTDKTCNCESLLCSDFHGDWCTATVTDVSPKMVYAGKVCVPCARRVIEAGHANLIEWNK